MKQQPRWCFIMRLEFLIPAFLVFVTILVIGDIYADVRDQKIAAIRQQYDAIHVQKLYSENWLHIWEVQYKNRYCLIASKKGFGNATMQCWPKENAP